MTVLSKPLAYITTTSLSVLTLLTGTCAAISHSTAPALRKARFVVHLGCYVGALAVCSWLGVVYSVLLTIVGQRLNINYLTARTFCYLCSPLIGIRLEVEGEEHLEAVLGKSKRGEKGGCAVLVGNHQSFMDILYLGRIFPKRASIMAKRELKWMPLLGWFMSLSGAVFVDRKNRKDAVQAMNVAGEDMKRQGVSLWIFPEGTRSSGPEPNLLPFKKGAFHLAVQAGVPIIPVVCESYHRLFDGKTRMERGVLKIKVLPPISTDGMSASDVHQLTDTVRDQMLTTLKEISTPSPEARIVDAADEAGEDAPLMGRSSGVYGSNDDGVRRRASRGSSADVPTTPPTTRASREELAQTGSIDARGLVEDAKVAVGVERDAEGEDEDEVDENGAVLVKKPE
ncbi:hypothetical protein NliqN6_4411 [Naganishia liquefaciens]|uniref:1-acyl-sn-glycerol-3-phosphate acyltransferase n=1 Tax=Naganishia liquefaciens TaxID=104408 RepID=A0A8H3TXJ1_9TREE|nr:hypothetical protein NliqN6_4411 [Naganishia liquefaciens]